MIITEDSYAKDSHHDNETPAFVHRDTAVVRHRTDKRIPAGLMVSGHSHSPIDIVRALPYAHNGRRHYHLTLHEYGTAIQGYY